MSAGTPRTFPSKVAASRAPATKSSQSTSGCWVHSVRSTRPGAAASCGSDDPYWYVMSGGSPPCRATVSFCSALSLLTNSGSIEMSGFSAFHWSSSALSESASASV